MSIDKETQHSLSDLDISHEIVLKWPEARIWKCLGDVRHLVWEPIGPYFQFQYRDGVVSTDGAPKEIIAEVAIWYRSIVPTTVHLYLFHMEGFDSKVLIDETTDERSLIDNQDWL
jgi:hypothetical protein